MTSEHYIQTVSSEVEGTDMELGEESLQEEPPFTGQQQCLEEAEEPEEEKSLEEEFSEEEESLEEGKSLEKEYYLKGKEDPFKEEFLKKEMHVKTKSNPWKIIWDKVSI